MEKLYVAQNPLEVRLVKHQLELHEIPCVIRGESLWGARGELPPTETWPTIWIYRAEDRERALQVIDAYHSELESENLGLPWRCIECGETIEPQFEVCWQCGAEEP